jgi:hypothetical protein
MKWIGQSIWDQIARFRNDVYLESISTGTIASGAHLGLDSNNKIVKAVDGGGDLTSIVAGTGLSGTSLTGPIPTINIDAAQPTVTSLGTLTALTGGTGDFIWNTNTLVVDTSESKVGVGTSSPEKALDVFTTTTNGGIRLSTTGTSGDLDVVRIENANSTTFPVGKLYMYYGTSAHATVTALSNSMKLTGGINTSGHIDFFSGTTEKMRLTNTGLGIGTTSPGVPLEVQGSVKFGTAATGISHHIEGTDEYRVQGIDVDGNGWNSLHFKADGDDGLFLQKDTNNVGIGTTSPTTTLEVKKVGSTADVGIRIDAGRSADFFIDRGATSSRGVIDFLTASSRKWRVGNAASGTDDFQIFGASNNEFIINSGTGNIGIGTTSPTRPLHVVNTSSQTVAIFDGGNNGAGEIAFTGAGTSGGTYVTIGAVEDDMSLSAGANERMRITSAGNVGVGVTAPASKLHVAGTVQVGVDDTGHDVTFYGDASGEYMQWDTSEAKLKIIHTDEAVGLEVYTNASAQTTQPQLKVGRAATEYWGAYCADRTAHLVHRQDETSGSPNTSFEIWDSNTTDSAAYWVWRHANGSGGSLTEKMRLTKAGILSVAELDVSGNIDIDGITNLDVVDIDGAVQIDSTLTVGVDDTGHDVRFYGATSGSYMMWDESQNRLRLTDDAYLTLGDGDDIILFHNGSNSYLLNDTGDLYITNRANDKDIIFQSDDGSGGVETYFYLDGSASSGSPYTIFPDNSHLGFGSGYGDLQLHHNGTNSYIKNRSTGDLYIMNEADDKDIIFQSDDGAGGNATYFKLDGSLATHDGSSTLTMYTKWDDNSIISLGTGNDIRLYHNGTNSYLDNLSGDYYIRQKANDKDLILECDDGSGGNTAYLTLDGSAQEILLHEGVKVEDYLTILDTKVLYVGSGLDLRIHHNGSDSYISQEGTGSLIIRNTTNDEDITFQCDDGSGGTAEYFRLDGGDADGTLTYTKWADNSIVALGAGKDLRMYHNGTNSIIQNYTGNLSIRNGADDGDIIFDCDDGSGGLAEYFRLDGGAAIMVVSKEMRFADNVKLKLGNGPDSEFYHDGSNTYITNATGNLYIDNGANDADIIFKGTDATADITALTLDMSAAGKAVFNSSISIPDAGLALFGTGNDLQINHDGSNSYINHVGTGHMYIQNTTDDKDIILRSDDGSGSVTPYLTLDGSASQILIAKETVFGDSIPGSFGAGRDLRIQHSGNDAYMDNYTGNMYFRQTVTDKDIIFKCDDGSGGNTAYLTLDGSAGTVEVAKEMNLVDDLTITGGNGGQLTITSGNVAWDASINLDTGGANGQWQVKAEGTDESFAIVNVDQGGTAPLIIHPTTKAVTLATPLATDQQKHVMHYDFQGYASGDGTNYEMANNLSDTNAPFEHNISIGADGTTATTVQNIIRSGGKVMPRACTLTRWTGWAAAAGSATAYVALFKVTPTRNSNTDLSAVLLDEFSYTALGNAKMEDFDETSFTATAIAAGDILITAMKSQSGAVHYFTSTVEVEF